MTTDTDVELDLTADLADLDQFDGKAHGYCRECLPNGKRVVEPGQQFPTLCGKTAFAFQGEVGDSQNIPPSVCDACMEFLGKTCPKCGAQL